jgi:hypothetical protein
LQLTFVPKVSFSCFFQRNESRKNRLIPTLYGNNIILRVGSSPIFRTKKKKTPLGVFFFLVHWGAQSLRKGPVCALMKRERQP